MCRNDLDFLHLETPADAGRDRTAYSSPGDNSPGRVLWEVGLVLVGALFFAVVVNEAFRLFYAP